MSQSARRDKVFPSPEREHYMVAEQAASLEFYVAAMFSNVA